MIKYSFSLSEVIYYLWFGVDLFLSANDEDFYG